MAFVEDGREPRKHPFDRYCVCKSCHAWLVKNPPESFESKMAKVDNKLAPLSEKVAALRERREGLNKLVRTAERELDAAKKAMQRVPQVPDYHDDFEANATRYNELAKAANVAEARKDEAEGELQAVVRELLKVEPELQYRTLKASRAVSLAAPGPGIG